MFSTIYSNTSYYYSAVAQQCSNLTIERPWNYFVSNEKVQRIQAFVRPIFSKFRELIDSLKSSQEKIDLKTIGTVGCISLIALFAFSLFFRSRSNPRDSLSRSEKDKKPPDDPSSGGSTRKALSRSTSNLIDP